MVYTVIDPWAGSYAMEALTAEMCVIDPWAGSYAMEALTAEMRVIDPWAGSYAMEALTAEMRVIDPWAGSYAMEALTAEMLRAGREVIDQVEEMGGMAEASLRLAQLKIEECAARKQAAHRLPAKVETIVGVNKYRLEKEEPLDVLMIDNEQVVPAAVRQAGALRAERDAEAVRRALHELTETARSGEGNLLKAAVAAARARATVGEITQAMEEVFGRHVATDKFVSGAYKSEYADTEDLQRVMQKVAEFAEEEGRRPRILVAKMGQDGHDRGAKVIATGFADLGFDVDVGPLFQTPEEVAQQAVDADVHVVGVSTLAAGHRTLVPALVRALRAAGRGDALVIVGGVIPPQDYQMLYDCGAAAVFGPGTKIPVAALEVLSMISKNIRERQTA
ncbi:methylmalonyl-CoA mutase, mitochondrial-like [Pollicipes pollicipes]|uniref:methylmalonyl-CoA mutase, mitochondrial-like n=1 Tax=Pollicipes pollicipes TaxID=41117 RepID=UPI0018851490|nr:methylmalonyl-CoA mutase, mitochondrial-like [Pollicipes pollicipes]